MATLTIQSTFVDAFQAKQSTVFLEPPTLEDQLRLVRESIIGNLTTCEIPMSNIAQLYAQRPSKYFLPKLVLLMCSAVEPKNLQSEASLHDYSDNNFTSAIKLAAIIEMIHLASLLHDDVLDSSDLRRGEISAPAKFGNKATILGGDFILARIIKALVGLNCPSISTEISCAIEELVQGELIQFNTGITSFQDCEQMDLKSLWKAYIHAVELKTASLVARAARCAAILFAKPFRKDARVEEAYSYGLNLGVAFQLRDDLIDVTSNAESAGKPCNGSDLFTGILTAPFLFALEENELGFGRWQSLLQGDITESGKMEEFLTFVRSTNAIMRTKELIAEYATNACQCIAHWPESPAKAALIELANKLVMSRGK